MEVGERIDHEIEVRELERTTKGGEARDRKRVECKEKIVGKAIGRMKENGERERHENKYKFFLKKHFFINKFNAEEINE